jgi:acyl-CoA reductase-like NAD-dependent aldehyde dehydrogenase
MSEYRLIIGGERIATREHFPVLNPATGELAGMAPAATEEHVDRAVAAARAAFASWRETSEDTRRAACLALAERIAARAEELARLLTLEQGKPLSGFGSRFELRGAQTWARHTASLDLAVEIVQDGVNGRIEIHRRPVGVVASITPWNWPLMIAVWHALPAIRTGNTVIVKPSPLTPLSTLRMIEIMAEGLPPGVLNVVSAPDHVAPRLTTHPDVAKVVFTGSTETGRKVMSAGAATLKRLTLELGGNDAGIVLPDIDPAAVAERLFWGAFINSGQTCAALKRLYVPDSLHDSLCEALVTHAAGVKVGDGLDESSRLGPVQNRGQLEKLTGMVDEACAAGARVLLGGTRDGRQKGYFLPTTLITDAKAGMRVVDEEQFGPILPIIRYHDVEDALRQANDSKYGLGGSVWSGDARRGWELAARLECGTAWVNRHGDIRPDVPFGGIKCSGVGVEFARQGLEEYTTIQVLHG